MLLIKFYEQQITIIISTRIIGIYFIIQKNTILYKITLESVCLVIGSHANKLLTSYKWWEQNIRFSNFHAVLTFYNICLFCHYI